METCFNNDLYFKIQNEEIEKRIKQFGNKLYLEIGGKLYDDYHASRVLPGFDPSSKLKTVLGFKDKCEIVIVVNTNDIESNKVRNDLGITYKLEVERLINAYNDAKAYYDGLSEDDKALCDQADVTKLAQLKTDIDGVDILVIAQLALDDLVISELIFIF